MRAESMKPRNKPPSKAFIAALGKLYGKPSPKHYVTHLGQPGRSLSALPDAPGKGWHPL